MTKIITQSKTHALIKLALQVQYSLLGKNSEHLGKTIRRETFYTWSKMEHVGGVSVEEQ